MAIAFNNVSTLTTGVGTTISTTLTASGANRIAFFGITIRNTRTLTSTPKYDGVDMTLATSTATRENNTTFLYYIINPTTTTNAVVTVTQSASDSFVCCAISYTGAKQSGQPDAVSNGGPTVTTSYSQSVTSVADNCCAVFFGSAALGLTLTAGANTTIRKQPEVAFTGAFLIDTSASTTPAGTITLSVTSSSQPFGGCMASFSPAPTTLSYLAFF